MLTNQQNKQHKEYSDLKNKQLKRKITADNIEISNDIVARYRIPENDEQIGCLQFGKGRLFAGCCSA